MYSTHLSPQTQHGSVGVPWFVVGDARVTVGAGAGGGAVSGAGAVAGVGSGALSVGVQLPPWELSSNVLGILNTTALTMP